MINKFILVKIYHKTTNYSYLIFIINDILCLRESMAEICLKNKMEFFYIQDEIANKLLDELESRFKFQRILFVGAKNSIKEEILSQKKRQLYYIFDGNFDCNLENIACVVCFNKQKIADCKSFCYKNKINYILVLDCFVEFDSFCLYKDKNQLIGIILDRKNIQKNLRNFVYNFVIECAKTSFILTESKINQLYFCDIKTQNLSKKCEKNNEIIDFFDKNYNYKENLEQILDYYFEMIMFFYNQNSCFLFTLCSDEVGYVNLIKTELILNIYSMFLQKSSPYCVKSASGGSLNYQFISQFDENKFWFVNSKFKLDVVNIIQQNLSSIENIKTICAKIDAERMFFEAKNLNLKCFKNQIYDLTSAMQENSLLKVIDYFGLLNF